MRFEWIRRARRVVHGRSREAGAVTIGALAMIIAIGSLLPKPPSSRWPTAPAVRGTFTESLVETGSVSAARLMLYSSTIAGVQAKIVEIVSEGSAVRPGDLLVRFETAVFEQNLARELAGLKQAEAELQRAREELRIEVLRQDGAADQARRHVGFAESALADQLEGRGKVLIAEAEAAAAEAARELERMKAALDDLRPLFAEGFVTRAELDRAAQAWQRAADQKRLAELRRDAAVNYEGPAAADRSRRELSAAREDVRRQGVSSASQIAQRQAAAGLAQSRIDEANARIAIIRDQIAHSIIRADVPGLVVYRDLFFGSDKRKPQVGDEVWPNQPLIALPDTSQLTVETRVREVDLHRLSPRQPVTVRVDAYPDIRLAGDVALVGALAQDDPARAGTKFFPVTVRIRETDPRLRTGMTATIDVQIASIPDAILIPAQAIFDRGRQPYCFVLRRGRPERQPVTIAGDNELAASIASGISPGDVVLLADPTTIRE